MGGLWTVCREVLVYLLTDLEAVSVVLQLGALGGREGVRTTQKQLHFFS